MSEKPILIEDEPQAQIELQLPVDALPQDEKLSQAAPSMQSVGTINEDMLTDEEKAIVERTARAIDVMDVDQIAVYGMSAQRNISEFSSNVLKKVSTRDLNEVGESLKDLAVALDSTLEPAKKGILAFFQKAKRNVDMVRAGYAKAEDNVDRIESDLMGHQAVLVQDISMYQQMYELNLEHYKELTLCLFAGKKALEEARSVKLPELKAIAAATNRAEDIQACSEFDDMCHRFEKKLADLEITRVICVQSATQIRLLQNNDREMLDKLQSSIANTIPLWRNQLVLSLGIEHTKRSLDAQNALADKTNELLARNSQALKMATIETAKASERPIVDVETLKRCNQDLIASITEVMQVHEQGSAKRGEARAELVRIEAELKQALMESAS